MDFKTADLLISSYSGSAHRTRKIFIILNIVSIILMIAFFNSNYSWLRHKETKYIKDYLDLQNSNIISDNAVTIKQKLDIQNRQRLIEKNAVDHRFLNIDLVGIVIYVEDLPLLGSFALAILLTWFFYSIRRETGIIREIQKRINTESDKNIVDYVFYGVSFKLLFNTIENVDEKQSVAHLIAVYVRRLLLYFPTIVLICVAMVDIHETFFDTSPNTWTIFSDDLGIIMEILLRTLLPVALLIYCFILTKSIVQLSIKDIDYRNQMQEKLLDLDFAKT